MADEPTNGANGAATQPAAINGPQFSVDKLYVKDVSFESPKSPQIFGEQAAPQLNMNLSQRVQQLGDTAYEVVLAITLTCTLGEGEGNTVYVVEVQQAGAFSLVGFEPNVVDALLGTQCPNVLYPYARQLISELITAGGFPQFVLQPINFDALYAESVRQRQQQAGTADLASSEAAGNA